MFVNYQRVGHANDLWININNRCQIEHESFGAASSFGNPVRRNLTLTHHHVSVLDALGLSLDCLCINGPISGRDDDNRVLSGIRDHDDGRPRQYITTGHAIKANAFR